MENSFIDNHDGTVTDETTGLMWMRMSAPFGTAKKTKESQRTERLSDYKQLEFDKWLAKEKVCPCRRRDMWREHDCTATAGKCSLEACPFYFWTKDAD